MYGAPVRPLAALAVPVSAGVGADRGTKPGRSGMARYLWALPNSAVGLVFVAAALVGGAVRRVDGVLEVHGPLVALMLRRLIPLPGGAAAITFGHIVAARDARSLDLTRSHERVHVRQCEQWGPFFIPAYLLASLWSWAGGYGAYEGNYFEREARQHERV